MCQTILDHSKDDLAKFDRPLKDADAREVRANPEWLVRVRAPLPKRDCGQRRFRISGQMRAILSNSLLSIASQA
jgi:hypothetical protein